MGTLFIFMSIFIISAVYAITEENKEFCKFFTTSVFTPGEYEYINEDIICTFLIKGKTINPFASFGAGMRDKVSIKTIIKYEEFELFVPQSKDSTYTDTCHIRGKISNEERWTTVLLIDTHKNRYSQNNKIQITPVNKQSGSDEYIEYLQNVDWYEVVTKEHRDIFKAIWSNPSTKKSILPICTNETTQITMQCLQTKYTEYLQSVQNPSLIIEDQKMPITLVENQQKDNQPKPNPDKKIKKIENNYIFISWCILITLFSVVCSYVIGCFIQCALGNKANGEDSIDDDMEWGYVESESLTSVDAETVDKQEMREVKAESDSTLCFGENQNTTTMQKSFDSLFD